MFKPKIVNSYQTNYFVRIDEKTDELELYTPKDIRENDKASAFLASIILSILTTVYIGAPINIFEYGDGLLAAIFAVSLIVLYDNGIRSMLLQKSKEEKVLKPDNVSDENWQNMLTVMSAKTETDNKGRRWLEMKDSFAINKLKRENSKQLLQLEKINKEDTLKAIDDKFNNKVVSYIEKQNILVK